MVKFDLTLCHCLNPSIPSSLHHRSKVQPEVTVVEDHKYRNTSEEGVTYADWTHLWALTPLLSRTDTDTHILEKF